MRIIVGVSGASGAVYGWELLKFLSGEGHEIHAVVSANGWKVLEHECNVSPQDVENLVTRLHAFDNLGAAIASGSFKTDAMVVAPCSMRTVAAIAHGLADNLLCRAADVVIKERRRLVLVPRETPLSSIHLVNMLSLSNLGVTIMPASPGFYHLPENIDGLVKCMVGRIADALGVDNQLFPRWAG
ncbi:UbiX family flavin prenyltransferase [Anaeroselena agilis]|uniref:Flavin prenyltransferase UbiX n=1 Tax=Anaeroselena agilis TaxID=3063788 RepID=A0ABU3P2V7_9FIRM|nr:UbiX family flavin prenyltransferase [Selenomonadales bacterium 4137-cl]